MLRNKVPRIAAIAAPLLFGLHVWLVRDLFAEPDAQPWYALASRLQTDPISAYKLTSFAFGLAFILYVSSRVHGYAALILAFFAPLALASHLNVSYISIAAFSLIGMSELHRRNIKVAIFAFAILAMTTPTGWIFSAVFLVPILVLQWRAWQISKKTLILIVLLAAATYAAWHFRERLQITFVRAELPLSFSLKENFQFWLPNFFLFLLWITSLFSAIQKRQKLLIIFHAGIIILQCLIPGTLIVPLMLGLAVPLMWRFPKPISVALVLCAVCGQFAFQELKQNFYSGELTISKRQYSLFQALGQNLQAVSSEDDTILTTEFSTIGYESGLDLIDPRRELDTFLSRNPEWVVIRFRADQNPDLMKPIAQQPYPIEMSIITWQKFARGALNDFEQSLLVSSEFHARYATVFITPEFRPTHFLALFCRLDVCETTAVMRLRTWSPNYGHAKLLFNQEDALPFLYRTTEIFPGEEQATLAYASKKRDRETLRKLAKNWAAPPWVRIGAYTSLGLDEYDAKEFKLALSDFESALAVGRNWPELTHPTHFSNVGWALEALGRNGEAQEWFKKGGLQR